MAEPERRIVRVVSRGNRRVGLPPPIEIHAIIEYFGFSLGDNARGGAGVIIRAPDGIYQIRGGVGVDKTMEEAEYDALIIALRTSRDLGFTHLIVRGNSDIIHGQINGEPISPNHRLSEWIEEANDLLQNFLAIESEYLPPGAVREAGIQAIRAVFLGDDDREMDVLHGE